MSSIGFAFATENDVLREAARSAEITHNHPEGIKGAQAAALAVFLARTAHDKQIVREKIVVRSHYDLDRTVESIRTEYRFDVSCPGTAPEAIIAFLESDSCEDAVCNAISLAGDSNTLHH